MSMLRGSSQMIHPGLTSAPARKLSRRFTTTPTPCRYGGDIHGLEGCGGWFGHTKPGPTQTRDPGGCSFVHSTALHIHVLLARHHLLKGPWNSWSRQSRFLLFIPPKKSFAGTSSQVICADPPPPLPFPTYVYSRKLSFSCTTR